MRKYFIILSSLLVGVTSLFSLFVPISVEARTYRTRSSDVRVHGYFRSNGTYVQPHYRSKADGYRYNNYTCLDHGRCW